MSGQFDGVQEANLWYDIMFADKGGRIGENAGGVYCWFVQMPL